MISTRSVCFVNINNIIDSSVYKIVLDRFMYHIGLPSSSKTHYKMI